MKNSNKLISDLTSLKDSLFRNQIKKFQKSVMLIGMLKDMLLMLKTKDNVDLAGLSLQLEDYKV